MLYHPEIWYYSALEVCIKPFRLNHSEISCAVSGEGGEGGWDKQETKKINKTWNKTVLNISE